MISLYGLRRASLRLAPLYWCLLAACFAANVIFNLHAGILGADFRGTMWQAGRDIFHGVSPYPRPDVTGLANAGNPAVYPAATLVVVAPLGLLPFTASALLWDGASVVALWAALRLVGVRDWRVFAVVFLSFPVAASLVLGQFDAFLALGCAIAWRWRRTGGVRLAACLAMLVVAKVLLWPLLVWAFASGRRREAIGGAAGAVLLAISGWAVIGFAGFKAYPHLLSSLANAFGSEGYSLMAAGTRIGLGPATARLLPLGALGALCVLSVVLARKGRVHDSYIAAVGAAILGSPILWMHYLVIAMVAIAAKRPRFSGFWLVPAAFWLAPTENPGHGVDFAIGFFLLVLLFALALRRERPLRASVQSATTARHLASRRAGLEAS